RPPGANLTKIKNGKTAANLMPIKGRGAAPAYRRQQHPGRCPMKLHAPSHSRLLSLLSAALPLDGGRARQLRALHLANRQALLAQQALLYCLLNGQAWAGPYLDESRAALLRSQA